MGHPDELHPEGLGKWIGWEGFKALGGFSSPLLGPQLLSAEGRGAPDHDSR